MKALGALWWMPTIGVVAGYRAAITARAHHRLRRARALYRAGRDEEADRLLDLAVADAMRLDRR